MQSGMLDVHTTLYGTITLLRTVHLMYIIQCLGMYSSYKVVWNIQL